MFERPLHQPGVQGIEIEWCGATKLQVGLHMELVIGLGPPPACIEWEYVRINLQLLGHERDYLVWSRLEVVRHKAQIAEDTQLEGIAEAILRVSLASDFPGILRRQQEENIEIVLWNSVRKTLPAFPLGIGEKVDRHTIPSQKKDRHRRPDSAIKGGIYIGYITTKKANLTFSWHGDGNDCVSAGLHGGTRPQPPTASHPRLCPEASGESGYVRGNATLLATFHPESGTTPDNRGFAPG